MLTKAIAERRYKILRLPIEFIPYLMTGMRPDGQGNVRVQAMEQDENALPTDCKCLAVSLHSWFDSDDLAIKLASMAFPPVQSGHDIEEIKPRFRSYIIPQRLLNLIVNGDLEMEGRGESCNDAPSEPAAPGGHPESALAADAAGRDAGDQAWPQA